MMANEPKTAPSPGNEADAWFTPGRFMLLLGGLIVLTFPRILLGQETFFYRDFGVFGYPLAHFQRECFWRGELPLWNPYNFCGLPFLAQWNTLTLYPPALFYLIFPLSWSLGVFNLGHLFLAGTGVYFLARRWTGNSLAAAAAGLLFAFNGLTWHCLMWPNDIAGLGWMPWVVLTVERAWREGGRRRIVAAALAGAMQMLAGAPEIILLTWAFLGAMWLLQAFQGGVTLKYLIGRSAAVCLLVAGLAAAQLLPFLDLLRHSHRDTGFGSGLGWAMPLSGLANFFAPLFHCYPSSHGVFVQYDQYWIPSYYLGAGAMILAAMAAWRPANRRICLLATVAILSVWMALGGHGYLYTLATRLMPALGFMRYPIKFVVLAVFLIPILAAYGLQRLQSAPNESTRPRDLLAPFAVLMLGLLALLAWVEWKHPGVSDNWTMTWHDLVLRGTFVVLVTMALMGLRVPGPFRQRVGVRVALLLLLWLDVLTHAPNLSPTVARSVYEPGLIRASLKLNPQSNPGESRFMETSRDMEKVHFISLTNAVNDYLCRRLALFDNCNLLDGVPKTDGFYSLYIKETMQAVSLVYSADETNLDLAGLKNFLAIGHVSTSSGGSDQALDWKTRDGSLPLVTAGQKPVFAAEDATLTALAIPNFDSREIVYLPPEAQPRVTATRASAKIIAPEIRTQRLQFEVDADAPTMVVVAQSWYRPWHAYVDGQRVSLWRANHAFQALEVSAGRHQVKLIYEDRVFEIGAAISLVSLALMGAGWFWRKRAD